MGVARILTLLVALTVALPLAAKEPDRALSDLIAGSQRTETLRARDQYRHPVEMLAFAGVKKNSTVLELLPGQGYWAEILGPYLARKGRYIAALPDPTSSPIAQRSIAMFDALRARDAKLFGKMENVKLDVNGILPDGTADIVLVCRNLHDFMGGHGGPSRIEPLASALYRALKPGGVLIIEDHRADPTKPEIIESGYVREDHVVDVMLKAGFSLVAKSELLANPRDTHDHPAGVFSLPPVLIGADRKPLPEVEKAKYLAIGESDRFLLKFKKP